MAPMHGFAMATMHGFARMPKHGFAMTTRISALAHRSSRVL
jgi:hypothetical protein